MLKNTYPTRYEQLKPLPYNLEGFSPEVKAESAILIDISNGNILYEKNSQEIIPPASMTKLFALYVVEQEIAAGRLHYNDIIPLPPESWACNMPPHSSLMFLGKGQKVTLEELLLGLSVSSGNDAAYALAYTICGSMEAFVDRMNQVATNYGLTNTHFVESSGYSELNTTTAREMATFCRIYLNEHPDSLKRYHSVKSFTYPKEHNMADGDEYKAQDWSKGLPEHITMGITQKNTNPLLDKLEGCDGLKTGYIDESGYNLALTAERNGTRFLSVTMKGPGRTTAEGQQGRIADGIELMEKAFETFCNYKDLSSIHNYFVKTFRSKEKAINLVPAFTPEAITVPFAFGDSIKENLEKMHIEVIVPSYIAEKMPQGTEAGRINFFLEDYLLDSIPLVTDRTINESNFIVKAADRLILLCKPYAHLQD